MTENAKVVVTLKAGGGYDAPWVVFHGDTVQEVQAAVQTAELTGLYAVVGKAAEAFAAQALVGGVLGATPVAAPVVPTTPAAPATPAVQAGPPGTQAPSCPHGVKTYKTSKPGAAKTWKAWMCPTPQGTPGQCPPEWIN